MRSKLVVGLVVVLAAAFLVSGLAVAQQKPAGGAKLLCVSKKELKGEETVNSCLAKGEKFAIIDASGIVHILTPDEVELTKAFNPKVFETRAYGMKFFREAPALPPLPVSPEQQ